MVELTQQSKFKLCIQRDSDSRTICVGFDNLDWAKAEGAAFANDTWYRNVWIEQNGHVLETIQNLKSL